MEENKKAAQKKKISHAIIMVVLILLFLMFIFPFILVIINAFKTKGDIMSDPMALVGSHGFILTNFSDAMKKMNFTTSFTNSLIITVSRDITQLTSKQDPSDADAGTVLPLNDIDGIEAPGGDIISSSQSMHNVMTLTKRLASVNTTVLITGESGVGKGLIAKQLHEEGNRCEGPFVTVNCGAIPDNLIESELFGYAPGAFTGSRSDGKKGLFEVAQSGTIFLDEISELPLNMQVKLLRVIQEREITPVGGVKPIPIDVRIVSALSLIHISEPTRP